MRLPWWGVLCVIAGTLPLGLLFVYFRRFDLARPSIISAATVALAITLRWKLSRHVWFWITMTFLAALHLPLIVFVPWTTKWIPARRDCALWHRGSVRNALDSFRCGEIRRRTDGRWW